MGRKKKSVIEAEKAAAEAEKALQKGSENDKEKNSENDKEKNSENDKEKNSDIVETIGEEKPVKPPPKKRGRKPKPKPENSDEVKPLGQRKRGRRKKYTIDSIKKLRENGEEDRVVFASNNDHLENLEQTQVSFGSLNITVHKEPPIDKYKLRKMFDDEFKMKEDEKAPTVLLQERGVPVMITKSEKETTIFDNDVTININDDFDSDEGLPDEDLTISSKISEPKKRESFQQNDHLYNTNLDQQVKKISRKKIHKVLKKYQDSLEKSKKWPKTTNIWCWWCCHPFEGTPVPCPVNYDEVRNRFEVKGIFCSWSCSSAYSVNHYKSLAHVYLLKRRLGHTEKIRVAPPKICLENFGGPMSIEKFREFGLESGKKEDHNIQISTEHISYINQEILETYTEISTKKKISKKA
jgi:hypothetical protein